MPESRRQEGSDRLVLYYDNTKQLRQAHSSGLNRVSRRLMNALSKRDDIFLKPVKWSSLRRSYICIESGKPVGEGNPGEVFFSPEVFALSERRFSIKWMKKFRGKTACLFYDAIPHKNPDTTWPKSVRRFPKLLRDLSLYCHVFYISEQARLDALRAAEDLKLPKPEGSLLGLGCDYMDKPPERIPGDELVILQVGIVEPRKGQGILLQACEKLWDEGAVFKLVLLGRVNPHFGKPVLSKIREMIASGRNIIHKADAGDEDLAMWHGRANLQVSPSMAEGFGLPVVEALWAGCPVLSSAQPVLKSLSFSTGIQVLEEVTPEAVYRHLRSLILQPGILEQLAEKVDGSVLPTWSDTAEELSYAFRCMLKS